MTPASVRTSTSEETRVLPAIGAFVRRDFRIARSYRFPFALEIGSALFVVVEFALVGKLVPRGEVVGGYFGFVTVGLVVSVFLASGVSIIAGTIRQEQVQGTLEVALSSGLSTPVLGAAMAAYPILAASVRAVVYVMLGPVFGMRLPDANWSLAVVGLALASVSFAALGLMVVALVLVYRHAAGATSWLVSMLTFAAGVIFPLRLLPGWMQWLSNLSPVTQALRLARRALLVGASWSSSLSTIGVLIVMALVFSFLGIAALSAGLRRARSTGGLAQY